MSNARDMAGLSSVNDRLSEVGNSDGALSNRNLIINGAMQVAQRGTSVTAGSSNTYTLDRWIAREGVVSQSTDVPTGKGFKHSAFYDNNVERNTINMRQVIEDGFTLLDGQDVTISFWIKTSVTTNISVDLHDTHTSGYSLSCPANTWVHHTYTATGVDTSAFTNYWSGPHAHVDFNFGGSYPDVHITGVQLEVGDTATPFEHRSYGDELQRCKRFFEVTTLNDHTFSKYNSGSAYGNISWEVEKRSAPTVTFTGDWKAYGSGQAASSVVNLSVQHAGTGSARLQIDSGSYSSYFVRQTTPVAGLIFADSEL